MREDTLGGDREDPKYRAKPLQIYKNDPYIVNQAQWQDIWKMSHLFLQFITGAISVLLPGQSIFWTLCKRIEVGWHFFFSSGIFCADHESHFR